MFRFSIRFLMLEIFWIAAALGLYRATASAPDEGVSLALFLGAMASLGAAVGGLLGSMLRGAAWTVAGVALVLLFVALAFHNR